VIRDFVANRPVVKPARRRVTLDITPETYYEAPTYHARRLYEEFLGS